MRLLVWISYNGAAYHGWQVQPNGRTVQQTVQDAWERLTGKRDGITGCSRTDAGVHARRFAFHVDTDTTVPPDKLPFALNPLLPPDIAVVRAQPVPPDFHARYSARGKEYLYRIWNSPVRSPFLQGLAWQVSRPLNVERMRQALPALLGTHDFSSFCASGGSVKDKVRTLYRADVRREGEQVWLQFAGDGFLYNMVRILVGTLTAVSEGSIRLEQLPDILQSKDRARAGKTAPPDGLVLNRVFYDGEKGDCDG